MDFDWDGEEDKTIWRVSLAHLLADKGFKKFVKRWLKWKENQLGGRLIRLFVVHVPSTPNLDLVIHVFEPLLLRSSCFELLLLRASSLSFSYSCSSLLFGYSCFERFSFGYSYFQSLI